MVAESYHVEGIPMLVLIDKKGVVRSVHVGYSPAIKATLRKELDAILAGKDLPKEPSPGEAPAADAKDEGVEKAWSVNGPYQGLAAGAKGQAVYALQGGHGRCDVIVADGKTTRSFGIAGGTYIDAPGRPAGRRA